MTAHRGDVAIPNTVDQERSHLLDRLPNAALTTTRRARWACVALVATLAASLGACGDSVSAADDSFDISFDFANGYQGWTAGFADYPVGKETEWALSSSLASLPAPLDVSRKAILLSGQNHSDDLFMYITREGARLAPNTSYTVRLAVTIASNAPKNCVGIGGSPGESVVLKVGAMPVEPGRVVDSQQYYRATFDHGAQFNGGRDATPVGNIATSNTNCAVARYELKEFDNSAVPLTVTTTASGRIWFVVGVDSGFEGTTSMYITSVRVAIKP